MDKQTRCGGCDDGKGRANEVGSHGGGYSTPARTRKCKLCLFVRGRLRKDMDLGTKLLIVLEGDIGIRAETFDQAEARAHLELYVQRQPDLVIHPRLLHHDSRALLL